MKREILVGLTKRIMYYAIIVFVAGIFLAAQTVFPLRKTEQKPGTWVLVIHGGAGGPPAGTMPEKTEQQYKEQLSHALQVGAKILDAGGSSLDAVVSVLQMMEDCPLFNAGKGGVLTSEGKVEMDASVMDGKTGMAGAVACVTTIKNPVLAARAVMEHSKHVMLIDGGAEEFARSIGLEMEEPAYFITPERWKQWEKSHSAENNDTRHGTVGAVALDKSGNLAAATSTGGMMNKLQGRVGDSPVIGAGTYADNTTCAVSCTGHGEFFMRNLVAYDVSALMAYKGLSLEEAASFIIHEKLKAQGGKGGLIAVDKAGNVALPFNTNLMFRGIADQTGKREVMVY